MTTLGSITSEAQFNRSERQALPPIIERNWIEPRRDIVAQGESPANLHVIVHGLAYRYHIMRDGSRQIISFLFPGDPCDADLFFLCEMDHGVRALVRTEVVSFSRAKVLETMGAEPKLAKLLWFSTVQEGAILRQMLVKMGRQKALGRIAHLLYELFLRYQMLGHAIGDSFVLPLTQDEVADTLGMTPVHVNRILKRLRKDGLISLQGRKLTIVDHDGLRSAADFDSRYFQLLQPAPLGEHLGIRFT